MLEMKTYISETKSQKIYEIDLLDSDILIGLELTKNNLDRPYLSLEKAIFQVIIPQPIVYATASSELDRAGKLVIGDRFRPIKNSCKLESEKSGIKLHQLEGVAFDDKLEKCKNFIGYFKKQISKAQPTVGSVSKKLEQARNLGRPSLAKEPSTILFKLEKFTFKNNFGEHHVSISAVIKSRNLLKNRICISFDPGKTVSLEIGIKIRPSRK